MKDNIIELNNRFKEIQKKGWIKSIRKGSTGVGMTFENQLGKTEENFEIPDFLGIEIKTSRKYSKSLISLFNAAPDGGFVFEIKRITQKFGYPDKDIKYVNRFCGDVYGDHLNMIGIKYKFKLDVNYKEEKVFLCVYNYFNKLIDKQTFWTFDLLKEKLERKFQYLALVSVQSKFINSEEYFYFEKLQCYHLINFEKFLTLLSLGKIRVTFKVGVRKDPKYYGQLIDHGTSFAIKKEDICFLFNKIEL